MSGALGYFTVPVADVKRGRAFYDGLFGWQFAPDATALHIGDWNREVPQCCVHANSFRRER